MNTWILYPESPDTSIDQSVVLMMVAGRSGVGEGCDIDSDTLDGWRQYNTGNYIGFHRMDWVGRSRNYIRLKIVIGKASIKKTILIYHSPATPPYAYILGFDMSKQPLKFGRYIFLEIKNVTALYI